MDSFKAHVSYGLRNVRRFTGRDTKQQFFPYLGFCFLSMMLLSQLAAMAFMPTLFTFGSRPDPFEFETMMRRQALISSVLGVALIVLLAAAVARRLRDTARSAWWGLLPLPFLFTGLALFFQMLREDNQLQVSYFLIAFPVIVVYLATLAILLWLLTRPSHYPPPPGASYL